MINILMDLGSIIGIAVGALVLILIIVLISWVVKVYNNLVKSRNKVKTQWAQIDVQVKRRFDLIPNLVETVKGYAKHESDILTQFADARKMYADAKAAQSPKGMAEADANLTKSLSLFVNAVSEQYPQLKADANFNALQTELKETEDKIAYQRQFYNDVVMSYNNTREVFPAVIIANMFSFKEAELFNATEEERNNAPKVSF
jgi:LemA protein